MPMHVAHYRPRTDTMVVPGYLDAQLYDLGKTDCLLSVSIIIMGIWLVHIHMPVHMALCRPRANTLVISGYMTPRFTISVWLVAACPC